MSLGFDIVVIPQPQFHGGYYYFNTPIRVGSYARPLDRPPLQGTHSNRVLIQVAETLESRQNFARRLVVEAVARDALRLMGALGLVAHRAQSVQVRAHWP